MGKKIGWGIMTFLAFLVVLLVSRYFTFNPEMFFPEQRDVYLARQTGIYAHIIGGVLALGLGPFQFLPGLRGRWPRTHRWLGRIYLTGILVGGTAGLYMAFYAYAGIAASLGFGALAVLWLATGLLAYRAIRAGDVAAHRRWMARNFALTFAAVTLRLQQFPLMGAFGLETGYEIVAWTSWIPNLFVAEALIRGWWPRRRRSRRLTGVSAD